MSYTAHVSTIEIRTMVTKTGNHVNFVPTTEYRDACEKMCMSWDKYVHELGIPDTDGNTHTTDALTFKYLDYIVQNTRHPWLGTARIIEMTPKRRAMLDKMRGIPQPTQHIPPKRTSTDPAFVYPKQCGTKLHDDRSVRVMYCCECGMDFYDHHDISTHVPIHCPWCESGHVSETDPLDGLENVYVIDHIIRTRIATRGCETVDDDDDV